MNRKTQIIRAGICAVLGLAFAGSSVTVLSGGIGLAADAVTVYISAFAAAILAGLCTCSGIVAVIAGILLACGLGAVIAFGPGDMDAIRALLASWQGTQADAALIEQGGAMVSVLAAYVLGALFTGFVSKKEFAPLSVFIYIGLVIVGGSFSEAVALAAYAPGLAATVAAFAMSSGAHRDGSGLRLIVPAVLTVLVAFVLVPSGRVTWQPLENAAERVREVFEQYFNFSSERIAFSINEQGYDHAGMIGEEVVAMLGGPANPDTEPVMMVQADEDILLRGTIRTSYTGYSWIDETVKNRYLYYDMTRANVRDRVFGKNFDVKSGAFEKVQADVEMLTDGTSTLFVPAGLSDFSMDLANAVYYNSAGEMFMARPVEAGDRYGLIGLNPVHGEELSAVVYAALEERDDRYTEILAGHTALPAGIDSAVYTLSVDLTDEYTNPYDKAAAIQKYLTANYHYTLEPDYPPKDRDFVSYFLMDSKEGYCSYFASAMAVMCRIAGLPARYVEGYLARPDETGTITLTGEDAHAWVEVYFKGLGWVSFDPSGGQHSGEDDGFDGDDHSDDGAEMEVPDDELLNTPEPTPTPALHPEDNSLDNFESDNTEPEPTPTLPPTDENDNPFEEPEEEPEGWGAPTVNTDPWADDEKSLGWLWILLSILLVLALAVLAALFVRARLRKADPMYLSGMAKEACQAAMILYRANLTLLSHMGQGALSGESPEAFAKRISGQFGNEDFAFFVKGVSMSVYAGKNVDREVIAAGRRAYTSFEKSMRPMEKMRFVLTRVFRGLGSFEAIP